ncbi:Serine/Threonine kinase domain protein (macronuclear) [Tetrahymena thermophila SB210]|uniref:Serine/Threonine kinase domain protein n=1 Tax=Tetrahymena thermophila (strain SB210) TaxID=312017 RepID=I7MI67_TETTS|nr:Serine/Threonine kinase domain protein [Tetrahymena thermophila SB210]EAR90933.1 Serine/Threonine kinase domain protein [Tetrahymena thermophila SB210]|eukprot:XP_001011178.1 Serine/Threonine kinase domain protein [Tetrahymena thermophila SB210]
MEDRTNQLMNFVLNDQKHLRRYLESPSVFKQQKKSLLKQELNTNSKPLLKGQFFSYSKLLKNFKLFYFELYNNILIKYQDKTKAPPVEHVYLQYCQIGEENEIIGDSVAYGITLQNEEEIAKLVTDKFNSHKVWMKALRKFCRQTNFTHRYKVETRMYDHFYRCVDKKKKMYAAVKIVNKKGLKPEQKQFVNQEIQIFRRIQSPLLPRLKKIYEDESYIYMTFEYFQGEDLFRIVCASKLEEIAIATLTHHVLKGLKSLHSQNVFHGNLKLENIIFGATQREENEIFLINLKYNEEITEFYRERLIKKGTNLYVAPEVLEGGKIGPEMDMFALGVCVFYMAFGKYPYSRIEKITQTSSNTPITNNTTGNQNGQQNNQQNNQTNSNNIAKYKYDLDLKILENLQKEKKLNPSKTNNHILSASGIDFLMRLLDVNPETRLQASQALTHHWFINFTTKPTDSKKIAEFRQSKKMQSLITILECSEMSERELDHTRLSKLRGLTFQSIHTQQTNRTQTNITDVNYMNKSQNQNNQNSINNMNTSFYNNINNNNDVSTVYTQGGDFISDEGSVLNNLMQTLVQPLQPKLKNRDRGQTNPQISSAYNSTEQTSTKFEYTRAKSNSMHDDTQKII